ncbi:unnamed protein product (macronuclear) [Paramecium tetraurelia]|uniref:DNA replication factor Cdt1 C-terminal domain-containing protein n=1 Tax=Paramecium tetraurelia TaxID=5888 RepID=A0DD43_PARTE|nr:uncharacterized protein GSPATT00015819001 [Paramecium tetraurelia]CAK80960.1 unnamed protein product [Paramecium tetraurelia]|eukprot:XP_001448357.1 hypothetical protein (macronuclear) [Paramecium tetraurelia strain d4-2]
MKSKNINVAPDLNSVLQKKVRLCEDSQSTTLFNENSNSLESFPTLSKIASKYLNKPSLRERFQQINNTGNLQASKYYTLISILSAIDSQLLFLKYRRESLFWPNIVKSCYDSQQLQVTTRQLQEILTVWSQSYIIIWEKFEKQGGNFELLLKFPEKQLLNSQELNSRKELFQNKLEAFLQLNGDYVEPMKLPQKPQFADPNLKKENNQSSKSDCVQFSQSINISRIFQDKDKPCDNKQLSTVSQKLIDKLRERKLQEKQKSEESQDDKQLSSKKQHILVATMLHSYYKQRDVSNMFFNNVLKYIHDHNTNVLLSSEQIKSIIMSLIQTIANWLQLIDNSGGQILRLNKEIDLPNIINQL